MGLVLAENPRCFGNCNGGRRACTLPGVCPRGGAAVQLTEADLDRAIAHRQRPLPAPLAPRQRGPRRIAAEQRARRQRLWRFALLCLALAFTLAFTGRARADTGGQGIKVGAHLYTAHFVAEPERPAQDLHDNTPGLYVLTQHFTAGVVRNSHQRWSAYAGAVAQWSALDFTVGIISGYQYRTVTGPNACPRSRTEHWRNTHGQYCTAQVGSTRAVLRPLVAVSYAVPIAALAPVAPRITLLGKGLHLSIEAGF